jgi:uncharacterized delta-60 repeat protein
MQFRRLRAVLSVEHLEDRCLLSGGGLDSHLLPSGALDPRFGIGGEAITAIVGATEDFGNAVALQRQSDGKIVVVGGAQLADGNEVFAVTRYNPNGSLDTGFGKGGTVLTSFGASNARPDAVAIAPTGQIVVAGEVEFSSEIALARYNTDGSLDTSFGTGGEVLTNIGFFNFGSMAVDSSDRVVVAVTTFSGTNNFSVLRYNTDGSLDGNFGSGGEVTTSFGSSTNVSAAGVALAADGRIVVAGTAQSFNNVTFTSTEDFALARYNTDGSLDGNFGTGGEVVTAFGSNQAAAVGVAIQPSNGAIVVAGTVTDSSFNEDFALARYNAADGSLDTTFGTGGEVTTAFGSSRAVAAGVAIDSTTGATVVTGTVTSFSGGFTQNFGVARYNAADGSLDTTFGTGGEVTTAFPNARASSGGVVVQNDGKVVVVGSVTIVSSFLHDIGLVRYNAADGSLDAGFGTGGEVTTNIPGPSSASASSLAIAPNGKVVVAGRGVVITSTGIGETVIVVVRYNRDGSLDSSFGTGGEVVTNFSPDSFLEQVAGVVVQHDGRVVVAAEVVGQSIGFGLVRYNQDGSLDSSFGTGGEVLTGFGPSTEAAPAGLLLDPQGRIVVAGTVLSFATGFSEDFALARYNPNGSLDSSFGTGGLVTTGVGNFTAAFAAGVALLPQGRIVVAGTFFDTSSGQDILVARYTPNGSLDSSFGTGGTVITIFPPSTAVSVSAVAVDPRGRIAVAGTTQGFVGAAFVVDFVVARYNTNGSLDNSFGTGGVVITDFGLDNTASASGIAIQPDGEIVVVGTVVSFNIATFTLTDEFAVVRYNPDGSLDSSFGTGGEVLTTFGANATASASAVALEPNGDILVAGTFFNPADQSNDFALVAYNGRNGHRR